MDHDHYDAAYLRAILTETRSIAVIGASANPSRPVHGVMAYLIRSGYAVTPINPGLAGQAIHGRTVVGRLADLAEPVDMIDVFRNSDAIAALADEILALPWRPKTVWLQLGIRNDAAAERLEAAGIQVVMDRCPAIERPRLVG
ncbi:CoA-binding protein [Prosthecomicrobium pneumaticum]|uniref:CoA-binding domain-containing protein n=1 Tax=Prosthecomicrobium pneumaticum TaxID=81895 RepID=A0A7W9FJ31_9HYPH|nr:CoA-binding protein [Prosthecomicrobium pneumaticum]MBB5751151.1 hypothetical protein [Prosthecomicrobium pneumaticum]